jgi:hypothetical protein
MTPHRPFQGDGVFCLVAGTCSSGCHGASCHQENAFFLSHQFIPNTEVESEAKAFGTTETLSTAEFTEVEKESAWFT